MATNDRTLIVRDFAELAAEVEAVPVDGWDFSWLAGRATEQRPSWGYQRLLGERMAHSAVALDIQTGGGEVLAGAILRVPASEPSSAARTRRTVATEGWPPNVTKASRLLGPLGVTVVADSDEPPLPFAEDTFDLIASRHPVQTWWAEIARTLAPGGSYLSQQVGPYSVFELVEFFLGPQSENVRNTRHPDDASAAAEAAGLRVVDLRFESLRTEFFDIGAVIYFLRKVIWMVPGFTVTKYQDKLAELHERIERNGPFIAHTTRFLIEAKLD